MQLKTINVIDIVDGDQLSVTSFSNDDEGKKEAEKLFTKLALEYGMSTRDAKEAIKREQWHSFVDPISVYIMASTEYKGSI